jgi:hydroxymethylpyrimidine pyrophosphatase-like HAD family hydrolase
MPYLGADIESFDIPIAKVVFADMREEAILRVAELLDAHPRAKEFDFIRSEKLLYEILPKGNSKGNLLREMSRILGIDMKRTVALGDYNNDVSMIEAAGVGIAVSNAVDEAKAVADRITVSNEEHALAMTVEEIERGVITFN